MNQPSIQRLFICFVLFYFGLIEIGTFTQPYGPDSRKQDSPDNSTKVQTSLNLVPVAIQILAEFPKEGKWIDGRDS